MIVNKESLFQCVGLVAIFSELHIEGAFSGPFFISLLTLVSGFPLLATVAVEYIDTVTVLVVSFSPL